jgi:hypothetical protein
MMGERSDFDFVLAETLGKTLGEIRATPNIEIVEWRAFYKYRAAMKEAHAR